MRYSIRVKSPHGPEGWATCGTGVTLTKSSRGIWTIRRCVSLAIASLRVCFPGWLFVPVRLVPRKKVA